MEYEWFMAFDHLPTTAAGLSMAVGDGGLTQVTAGAVGDVGGEHRAQATIVAGPLTRKNVPSLTQIVVGMRWRVGSIPGSNRVESEQLALYSGAALGLNLFRHVTDLTWALRRGTTVLVADILPESAATDYYIELSAGIDATAGDVTVRIDGAVAAEFDGNTGAAAIDNVRMGSRIASSGANIVSVSGMYIRERPAEILGFYGPLTFERLDLDSDVATDWTRSTGADSFALLDGVTELTGYVESNTLGDIDENGVETSGGSNSVLAVVGYVVSEAPSGGAPQIQIGIKRGANETYGEERTVGVGAPGTQQSAFMLQPDGVSGWSITAVNELVKLRKSA